MLSNWPFHCIQAALGDDHYSPEKTKNIIIYIYTRTYIAKSTITLTWEASLWICSVPCMLYAWSEAAASIFLVIISLYVYLSIYQYLCIYLYRYLSNKYIQNTARMTNSENLPFTKNNLLFIISLSDCFEWLIMCDKPPQFAITGTMLKPCILHVTYIMNT